LLGLLVADLPAELLASTAERRGEDVWVARGRPLALDVRLAVRVSEQQFLIIDVEALLAGPGTEELDETSLPVDERAVTVKAEDLVLGQVQAGAYRSATDDETMR
jgi:hypothetical protein